MKRIIGIIAAVTLAIAGITALTGAASLPSATALAPPIQICNEDGFCANHAGGGRINGTHIIAYYQGDAQNDFEYRYLADMCAGTGVVQQNCPFTLNSGLNTHFLGKKIVGVEDYEQFGGTTIKCIGTFNNSNSLTVLELCPNSFGQNGGWGTVAVATNDGGIGGIVSVRFSDNNYAAGLYNTPAYWGLCIQNPLRQQISENTTSGSGNPDTPCIQWVEVLTP